MSWGDLEAGAADLAREGWARFERTKVGLLGTVREDGSPRISPIEPYLISGELVIGVMPSPKLDDLRRDPRCALHSSVSDINGSEGEFKVHGRVAPAEVPDIVDAPGAWWAGRPRDRFEVFVVEVEEAILLTWSIAQDRMITRRWSLGSGFKETTRTYP